jgi:broad specificity phosphatase PhoE/flavodoxin
MAKVLIIYHSFHHQNTKKIALAMGEEVGAKVLAADKVSLKNFNDFDIFGFGSGIFFNRHHQKLFELVKKLPKFKNKKAFIFSTSGWPFFGKIFHQPLKKLLCQKGFKIIGEFNCPGFDTFRVLKLIGGINKNRPNERDLKNAKNFIKKIMKNYLSLSHASSVSRSRRLKFKHIPQKLSFDLPVEEKEKRYCHFYIVRHGLTDWNEKGLLQGQSDIPLNKEGEKQAVEAAKKHFKKIRFAAIFSSDLVRAKRTAEIIALEKKMAVETSKLIRERDFGPLEGKHHQAVENELKMDIKELRVLSEEASQKLGIESDEVMMARFLRFIREVAVVYPGKNVLIVTHGSVMRVFLTKLGYLNKEESKNTLIKNLAYIKVLSDGVDFFVKKTFGVEILI